MFNEVFSIFNAQRATVLLHTSIALGVYLVVFFNVSLGWVLSGLVVPGLLAPLLLASPETAAFILLESLFAHALFCAFSWFFEKLKLASAPFGRERFFAIVFFSVVARVCTEGLVLPYISGSGPTLFEWTLFESSLFTNGTQPTVVGPASLVLTALLANQFWKPGWKKGLLQATTTTLVTAALFCISNSLSFSHSATRVILYGSE
jgi:gamma-polyglutamate biosynthesis protein CapC